MQIFENPTTFRLMRVDVQCDYHKETLGNVRQGHADIEALEESFKIIGEKIECVSSDPTPLRTHA